MTKLLRSWVESANAAATDFPLNNLPYGVFSKGEDAPRCGTAIGDSVLDLHALEQDGKLDFGGTLKTAGWNAFMALGKAEWSRLRGQLTEMLAEDTVSVIISKAGEESPAQKRLMLEAYGSYGHFLTAILKQLGYDLPHLKTGDREDLAPLPVLPFHRVQIVSESARG